MLAMSEEITPIQNLIYEIRGKKVMLDSDLAKLYQVETKVLKQAVRRNIERFPTDFMMELSIEEYESMICSRSQIVTLNRPARGSNIKYKPFVFTEQGVAMLSSVLRSEIAIKANIAIMRAFVQVREYLQVFFGSRKVNYRAMEEREMREYNPSCFWQVYRGKLTFCGLHTDGYSFASEVTRVLQTDAGMYKAVYQICLVNLDGRKVETTGEAKFRITDSHPFIPSRAFIRYLGFTAII